MICPDLSNYQSCKKGQKRIDQAVEVFGLEVINRIIGFSLYLSGYPYDFISTNTGLSKAGLQTLINDLFENGVERFLDKRRNKVIFTSLKKIPKEPLRPSVKYIEQDNNFDKFQIEGSILLNVSKEDMVLKKILTLLFIDASLMSQVEAAGILNCRPLSVHQNLKKFKTMGVKGILDNRQGQTKEYRFETKVKGKIFKEYVCSILDNKIPTKSTVTLSLNKDSSMNYSESAVALHLKNTGLTDIKQEFILKMEALVNARIHSVEYLSILTKSQPEIYQKYHIPLKRIRDELTNCYNDIDNDSNKNIFEVEEKIEIFQTTLQSLMIEAAVKQMNATTNQCPYCRSTDVSPYTGVSRKNSKKVIKTSLGGELVLFDQQFSERRCNECQKTFDIKKDILQLSDQAKFTPLTQKKMCAANRAGSYENAVRNLKELLNLDVNRNQVRLVSNYVGEYIKKEFQDLYNDISDNVSPEIISERHPLVRELKIEEKYLDKSKYLIVFAIDGGRMQLFNWLPPGENNSKAKKFLYWHESKVFRLSIYDKTQFIEQPDSLDNKTNKKVYKSAKILSGLTTYGAANESWKNMASIIKSHLYVRGIEAEDIEVCLSDGSEHIMREIFEPIFPKARHILDYYHKTEALQECLKSIKIAEDEIKVKLKNYLWEGQTNKLIKALKEIQLEAGQPDKGKRDSGDPKVKLDNLINHLDKNKERLQYKVYRDLGYPIGSGSIESAVKLFGKRIKGTEKQWNDEGGDAILALYAFLLSEDHRWDRLWEIHTPWV